MNTKQQQRHNGFTLIELLVVIAVITILTTVMLASFNVARQKARDDQRTSDLTQIQLAIEQYYDDNGAFPTCTGGSYPTLCVSTSGVSTYGSIQTLSVSPTYLRTVPVDPLNQNATYGYYYARGYRKTSATTYIGTGLSNDYILATRLEGNSACPFTGWNNSCLNVLLGN